MLHIYTTNMQPATNWVDSHSNEPIRMGWQPEDMLGCICCGKLHPAKDCVVQGYYDGPLIFCAPGKGCKDPVVIAGKKAREFKNRSDGQKRRWKK